MTQLVLLLTTVFLFSASHSPDHPNPTPPCGAALQGLELCLAQSEQHAMFAEIRNVGANDVVLNLGIMLANGRRQYPKEIQLIFVDSGGTEYRAVMDEPALVAGRVDDLVVPLPAGGSVKLPLRLSPVDQTINPTKTYTARAEFVGKAVRSANGDMQGMALMPYWTNKLVSNTISVRLPLAK